MADSSSRRRASWRRIRNPSATERAARATSVKTRAGFMEVPFDSGSVGNPTAGRAAWFRESREISVAGGGAGRRGDGGAKSDGHVEAGELGADLEDGRAGRMKRRVAAAERARGDE